MIIRLTDTDITTLIQTTVSFFNNLFNRYSNINIYMVQSTEQGYMNFGLTIIYNFDIINPRIRKNLNLLDYTNDEYDNNAEIDILFNHKFSNKTTYEIYKKNNIIYFNFLHKNDKDFVQLLKLFVFIMEKFK